MKRTGDGSLIEFRSVVDAVRCAIEMQNGLLKSATLAFRLSVASSSAWASIWATWSRRATATSWATASTLPHDWKAIAKPGAICMSEDAYRQVRDKIAVEFTDLGDKELKNIARPMRAYAVQVSEFIPKGAHAAATGHMGAAKSHSYAPHLQIVVLPFANIGGDPKQEYFVDGSDREPHDGPVAHLRLVRVDRAQQRLFV